MRTRIKICGITRQDDARYCAKLGVDAIGLVFYPSSPRNVSIEQACEVVESVPAFMSTVGLFMNADTDTVSSVIDKVRLDYLQFHGDEPADYCDQFDVPYIKAVPMGDAAVDVEGYVRKFPHSRGFLFDSHTGQTSGGTGKVFDWKQMPDYFDQPVILAGGLQPDNVQSAIRLVRPYAIDCSSGVESSPGIKSHEKIKQFVEKVCDV